MSSQFFVSVDHRRVRVVVHEDRDELVHAAAKHDKQEDFTTAGATFHPSKPKADGTGYYGTMRFYRG